MNILEQFKLDGKVALVTGCRRGIGRALAQGLAEAGADIIGVSANLALTGSEVEQDVKALGRQFKAYQCDFKDRQALYRFIGDVKNDFTRIDILVNNAGVLIRQPAVEHSDETWDKVLEVNLSAQFVLTREIGKEMLARKAGKVIFLASVLTYQGGILVPSYAASKGGIGSLTMAFANEWAGSGVNVNAVAPGYIATDNTAPIRSDPQRSERMLERIPAGRWGTPQDLKGIVVLLSSPASDFMHGSIVAVDGGWLAR